MDYYPTRHPSSSGTTGISIPTVWPAQPCGVEGSKGVSSTVSITATEKDPHVVTSYVNELDKKIEVLHAELSELFQRLENIAPATDQSNGAQTSSGAAGSSPLARELHVLNERLQVAIWRIQDFRRRVEL